MKKLAAVALTAGLLTASCAGHGGGSAIPPLSSTQSHGPGAGMTRTTSSTTTLPLGWVSTGTQAVSLVNATDQGPLPATQTLTVRVGLQLRNVAQLQQLVASGQTISQAAFMSQYAPTAQQASAVSSYLQSQGFTGISVEPNNVLVSATGTAAQVEKAFDTSLESYAQNGANVFANTAPAYVPQSLAGIVVAVLGLNDAAKMQGHPHKKPGPSPAPSPTAAPTASPTASPTAPPVTGCIASNTTPCVRFYDPDTYQVTYDAYPAPTAASTAIAIMAEGNVTQSITDFRYNEQQFGLPQVPVSVVQVGLPSPDTAGDDEWTLDMTYSSGIAQNVKQIYLYDTTSLTDSDIALEYNKWVTQDLAPIGNSSFGGCEFGPYLDGSMLVDDEILLQGAAQGQTMFVSTGDSGAFCSVGVPNGVPAGAPFVEYPAASPYVVAVGGTDLYSNVDGTYLGETAWESGGGGLSQFEYSPYWEASAQPVSSAGASFRGLPDVAMDASLETGALLYLGGTEYITGGTSLASPLAAGSYARMQSAHGNALGFAPVLFYKIYAENPSASATSVGPPPTQLIGGFHDVLTGSNVLYTAGPRYDYTTGLGSFDVYLSLIHI